MVKLASARNKVTGPLVAIGLILIVATAQNLVHQSIPVIESRAQGISGYLGTSIDPRIIRRLLGIRVLVADLVWIDSLIKGDVAHESQPFSTFYRAFRVVTQLDPDNIPAYYVAGMYLSVLKDDIPGATRILRDGTTYMKDHPYTWSESWKVPFALGYNLLFEEQEFEEGAQWVKQAASMPYAPKYVKDLAVKVNTEQGQLEVASRILDDMLRRVTRPEERQKIEHKMLVLATRQELIELGQKFETFLSTTGAYALPKQKAFNAFMKASEHSSKDLLGRPIRLNSYGKVDTSVDP
jgi:hypothetical protein